MNAQDLKLTPPAELNPAQRKVWDAYYEPTNTAFRNANLQGKDLVRWKYGVTLHDYLATIDSVDSSVGKLLDYLKQTRPRQEPRRLHGPGVLSGEHGWFDKRWIFESLRTLMVRWPRS